MKKEEIITVSKFIEMLEHEVVCAKKEGSPTVKTEHAIVEMKKFIDENGDFEFDLVLMEKHFGI